MSASESPEFLQRHDITAGTDARELIDLRGVALMGRMEGKVVLVTGIGLGQGRAHSICLGREGATIVGVDSMSGFPSVPYPMATESDCEDTLRLVEDAGGRMTLHRVDVRDREALDAVVASALSQHGRLDGVVANAGVCPPGENFWEITQDTWDTIVDIDLKGVFNTVSAAGPQMIAAGRGGSIVLTASMLGLKGGRGMAPYTAAKHGVIGLMRSFALDLAPHLVRVNAICPTAVDTNMINNDMMIRRFRPDLESPTRQDAVALFHSLHALPIPWIDPIDVARAALFLLSDDARYVTGTVLTVDGGANLK